MQTTNPDQSEIHRFLANPGQSVAFVGNPMAQAMGCLLVAADGETGMVRLEFSPAAIFVQGAGVLQGGAVTAMLDFSMAFALLAMLPASQTCATVGLNATFLRAAPMGRYVAVGEITKRGRTLAFAHARLFALADPARTVATATSTLAIAGRTPAPAAP